MKAHNRRENRKEEEYGLGVKRIGGKAKTESLERALLALLALCAHIDIDLRRTSGN